MISSDTDLCGQNAVQTECLPERKTKRMAMKINGVVPEALVLAVSAAVPFKSFK
jgi:hypothetical protein